MLFARDFREIARNALRGRWAVAVGTGFVAVLLGASSLGYGSGASAGSRRAADPRMEYFWGSDLWYTLAPFFLALSTMLVLWGLVLFIIGGAATLGYAKFNLNLVDGKEARFGDLFSRFDRIGSGFCMQFLRTLFILLWSFLLIIPGIIAAYRYAMTHFIMTENPNIGTLEAINRSKEMMYGNKWRLFCMQLSFIGWYLLSIILTFGIGLLWVGPYVEAANAAFYREISGPVRPQKDSVEYL